MKGIFMAQWTDYQDSYEVKIHRSNLKNIQEVEITDIGIIIAYGERPSKLGRAILLSIAFMKPHWTIEDAGVWFKDHEIQIIPRKHLGKKISIINWLIEDHSYFILACYRGSPKKPLKHQLSGEFKVVS